MELKIASNLNPKEALKLAEEKFKLMPPEIQNQVAGYLIGLHRMIKFAGEPAIIAISMMNAALCVEHSEVKNDNGNN